MNWATTSRTSGIDPLFDVRARKVYVFFGRDLNPTFGRTLDWFLYLRRCAGGENVIGNLDVFADHTSRCNKRAFADNAAVEQHRVAADERVAFDVAILHHRRVSDGDVVIDLRKVGHVNNGVILNRGAGADTNRAVVA